MKIEQLRQVILVAKLGSISKAADEMFLSQPNLSTSIKNLEHELGYKLFERTNHGIALTADGSRFMSSAGIVLDQFDKLAGIGKHKSQQEESASLKIAIAPYRYLVTAACSVYEKHRNGSIRLSIVSGSREEIIKSVKTGMSELGVLGIYSPFFDMFQAQMQEEDLYFMPLGELKISILVGKRNPLYDIDRDHVTREDLKGMSFAALDEVEYGTTSSLPELLGISDDTCTQRIYASSWSSVTDILRNTDSFTIAATNWNAYSVIPYYSDIRSFKLEGTDITNKVGWICRRSSIQSSLSLEFLQEIYNYF